MQQTTQNVPDIGRMLTVKAVCDLLNISRGTLRNWRLNPEVGFPKPLHIGKNIRWRPEDLREFILRQQAR